MDFFSFPVFINLRDKILKMKKEINPRFKVHRVLVLIILILGFFFLSYMISAEDEQEALSLFLVLAGSIWFAINEIGRRYFQKQ